jgi:DNA (cytosine-5)-methyltransferase 1
MREQNKKIKVIDLFAGAGGFGLGFRLAGDNFKVICSLEIDKWAVETLIENNIDNQKIIQDDIRKYKTKKQILKVCPIKPDIIIGGPPCQGFSIASSSKDSKDPRNSLFKNYAKWVDILKPKVFVMENVKGLLNGINENGEKVVDIIKQTFEKIGYTVTLWDLNAANYGVPQNRERIFFVGCLLKKEITQPTMTHFLPEEKKKLNGHAKKLRKAITVIKAIGDLPKLKAGEGVEETESKKLPRNEFALLLKDTYKLYNHVTMAHTPRLIKRYEKILEGVNMEDISDELKVRRRNGNGEISEVGFSSNYRHLKPNKVSFTIPASFYSNFVHPNQPRNITSREAARLQSFPDSYFFKGKRTQISSKLLLRLGKTDENYLSQYNQIGNAVPPLLAKAVANRIYEFMVENNLTQ